MSYSGQLQNLLDEAKESLSTLVRIYGEESEFRNDKVLKCDKLPNEYVLDGYRRLKEITENALIDDTGYEYASSVLDNEDFLNLVDYFIKKYAEPETNKK